MVRKGLSGSFLFALQVYLRCVNHTSRLLGDNYRWNVVHIFFFRNVPLELIETIFFRSCSFIVCRRVVKGGRNNLNVLNLYGEKLVTESYLIFSTIKFLSNWKSTWAIMYV